MKIPSKNHQNSPKIMELKLTKYFINIVHFHMDSSNFGIHMHIVHIVHNVYFHMISANFGIHMNMNIIDNMDKIFGPYFP